MNLSEVYANRVKKSSINMLSVGGNAPIVQNRDPTINKLEKDVFSKMKELVGKDQPNNLPISTKPVIKSLSFEEALKELANFNKNL